MDAAAEGASSVTTSALGEMIVELETAVHVHDQWETSALFPLIGQRCPPLLPVLVRLAEGLEREGSARAALLLALDRVAQGHEDGQAAFIASLRDYSLVRLGHLEVVQDYVLPVAIDYLSAQDWSLLAVAAVEPVFAPASR